MTATISPNKGFVKPTTRLRRGATFVAMGKAKTRRKKIPSKLRGLIAENITTRAAKVFKDHPNIPVAIRLASADSEQEMIAKSTIQRIMEAKTSATLEQLDGIARALEIAPYQLLIPDLDPDNPQLVKGATADEQALYKRIAKEAAREALQQTNPQRRK